MANLGDQVRQAEAAGADMIHIDVMDGQFVPPITMGPFIVETCRRVTALPLDVHLMIVQPELQIPGFASAGANIITVQQETCPHLHRTLDSIRKAGCKAGVALNPSTPETTLAYAIQQVDLVLVMTVNPGYGGQEFIPEMVTKIARVNNMLAEAGSQAWLQVDGGINKQTVRLARAAGANNFVAGSAIFNHPEGISAGINAIRQLAGD